MAQNRNETILISNGSGGGDVGGNVRLCKLKMAQLELETRHRQATADEPEALATLFKEETDKFLALKQVIDKDQKESGLRKKTLLNHSREAQYYKEKVRGVDINKLEEKFIDLKEKARQVLAQRDELKMLQKALEEFRSFEPTNESLKRRIDDLKKSRLSLEMSFG